MGIGHGLAGSGQGEQYLVHAASFAAQADADIGVVVQPMQVQSEALVGAVG